MNNKTKNDLYFHQKLVIPKRHQAVFSLTIIGVDPPNFYSQSITFETRYQVKKDLTNLFVFYSFVLFL
jgi:hypothetical protein